MGSGRDKGQNWLVDGVLPTHAANGDCGMNGAPKIWLGENYDLGVGCQSAMAAPVGSRRMLK
jgi:hypothetical protein